MSITARVCARVCVCVCVYVCVCVHRCAYPRGCRGISARAKTIASFTRARKKQTKRPLKEFRG